jgi:hypothetical protein
MCRGALAIPPAPRLARASASGRRVEAQAWGNGPVGAPRALWGRIAPPGLQQPGPYKLASLIGIGPVKYRVIRHPGRIHAELHGYQCS